MIVLLNGAFGIGKTTTAKLLRCSMADSAIYNPETVGYVLRRLPHWIPLSGRGTGDYQDMPLWRTMTVLGIRATRRIRPIVIVPMAFTHCAYLTEILGGLTRCDSIVRQFCLKAPLQVVEERLRRRGADPSTAEGAWQFRRAGECCAAHAQAGFGETAETAGRTPESIAADIGDRLACSGALRVRTSSRRTTR